MLDNTPHAMRSPKLQGNQVNSWQESQVWHRMVVLHQKYNPSFYVLSIMVDVFETMTDPDKGDSNLVGASSTNSFILVGSHQKMTHTVLSAATICFHYLQPLGKVSLIYQSLVFQLTDQTIGY